MDRKALRLTAVIIAVVWTLYGCAAGSEGPSTAAPAKADAGEDVDIGFSYDRLAPYGDWVQFAPYGWCWSPYSTPVGWRPYTDGRWVYTDDYGWTWDSDWDWGWACFHYGRWVSSDDLGWLWVPGHVMDFGISIGARWKSGTMRSGHFKSGDMRPSAESTLPAPTAKSYSGARKPKSRPCLTNSSGSCTSSITPSRESANGFSRGANDVSTENHGGVKASSVRVSGAEGQRREGE